MTILVIGYMHPKGDKRVFRTVKALSKKAKVIYQYWTDNFFEKSKSEGNIQYVPVYSEEDVKANPLKKLVNRRTLDKQILRMISFYEYDILYMHHFLASMPVEPFKIAKKRGKKVIYDIHEYHPQNFLAELRGFVKIVKESILWRIFKKQLFYSDGHVFVSKEAMEDIYNTLSLKKNYLIVPNYADIKVKSEYKRKEICFVGKVKRDITQEKEIIKKLINHGFSFKIIGMDDISFSDVPHKYTSFLPYEEMMDELSKCMFSLISYKTIENERYKNDLFALPHKYFDSIAAGTPVIVKKSFVSMVKDVEEKGLGIVIDPGDVDGSVQKILDGYENYQKLIENINRYKSYFVWDEKKESRFVEFVIDL
ncbi:glycosyl transferase family 1 [Thermosipho ferrireducens]|uniref:Glycosyl transferase family 1 n=1 Tax=Thermosipho ferrireducens TaxID=2571116 RepID=A0ABX7S9D9_9BACT|nr:glycosyl transferase family 1 [Thermosipho ferrireducens]QTA38894.1 glycosyl transferase family 1 [Thermosipho ferrireducens]